MATHRLAAIGTGEQSIGTGIALNLICLDYVSTARPFVEEDTTISTQTLNSEEGQLISKYHCMC